MSVIRHNCEERFPWAEPSKKVWYALVLNEFDIEHGCLRHENYPPEKKPELLLRLRGLVDDGEHTSVLLFGVWTGRDTTHLFQLDVQKAIAKLEEALGIVLPRREPG